MDWLAAIGSILGGFILVGGAAKAAPSVWRFIRSAARIPPMIETIFVEFTPNSGTTLPDKVDNLTEGQQEILAWQQEHAAEDIVRLTKVAEQAAQTDEYLHLRMHDVLNKITPIVGWATIHDRRLAAIEAHLKVSQASDERVNEHLIVAEREARQVGIDTNEHIDRVHDEVRTGNALSLGTLADDEETRRIIAKLPEDRTQAEWEHLHQIPSKEEH